MNAIADTGFIVAFSSHTDRHHNWALEVASGFTEPVLTCEAVLSEAAFHLKSSEFVLKLIEEGMLTPAFDLSQNVAPLISLAVRYADRHPDFADLCVIRMSELYPHHTVLTVDERDFRIYRRNKREVIPLLCPPKPQ